MEQLNDRTLFGDELMSIMQYAEERLQAHWDAGVLLQGLEMLRRADRMDEAISMPLLTIQPDTAQPTAEFGMSIDYNLPLRLVVQLEDHVATRGWSDSIRLATEAHSAIVTDPTTMEAEWQLFDGEGRAWHLSAGPVDMPAPVRAQQTLYLARATVNVRMETTI